MSSHNLAATPSVLLGSSSANTTTSSSLSNKSAINKIATATATTDSLSNNINKSTSNDLCHNNSLTTQAQTASQQLEMWLNGLQSNRIMKSSNSGVKNEVPKSLESSDAITKVLNYAFISLIKYDSKWWETGAIALVCLLSCDEGWNNYSCVKYNLLFSCFFTSSSKMFACIF